MARLTVVADEEAIAQRGAERVAGLIAESIEQRGSAFVCLTGGRTPRRLYERLASATLDWSRIHLFWGDERHVPPDHQDSNFRMANEALVSRVPIPPAQVHRIPAELPDAAAAARAYEPAVRDVMFDIMLLGLGEDGHIASLFRGNPLLGSDPLSRSVSGGLTPLVAAAQPRLPPYVTRITLAPRALLNARVILMIVSGASKADAVHAALKAPDDVARWPVHVLRSAGDRVEWLVDEAAATRL